MDGCTAPLNERLRILERQRLRILERQRLRILERQRLRILERQRLSGSGCASSSAMRTMKLGGVVGKKLERLRCLSRLSARP
jgi:hypothetical protein